MVYTREEVYEATLKYFNNDDLAANVFFKYCLQDKSGNYLELTPDDMHKRLAKEFARIESKYPNPLSEDEIYGYLKNFAQIVPQGSPMAGIGNNHQNVTLSNCYVIDPPKDTMSDIFETGKKLANLSKRRGGVGLDLSGLRPDGMAVNNSAKTSSGAWSFADFYSNIGRMVGQNGRRAAIMLTMDIRHPDIEKFITMKHDLTKVTGANVSVKLSDEFMNAVKNNDDFELRWPTHSHKPKITRVVKAIDLWNLIVKSATETAEPGLLMWDTILKYLPAQEYADVGFNHTSTNPCSELPLSVDSCRLISLNLKHLVNNQFSKEAYFDFDKWKKIVSVGQRLSDDLVDLELEKLDTLISICNDESENKMYSEFRKSCADGRRTGLGTHGLADCLARLNLKYDSDDGMMVIEEIYELLRNASYQSSVDLAKERGCFPVWNWEKEKNNAFIKTLPKSLRIQIEKFGRRNISNLTNAPTGSVSILSQTSSGLEPVYKNSYIRRKKKNHDEKHETNDFVDIVGDHWQEFEVFHHNVKEWRDLNPNKSLPDFFVESDSIDWQRRIDIQAIMTKYIDHSISSTINLPRGTSSDIVGRLYMSAWEKGLKGVTVYVDGSRDGVLVTKDNSVRYFDAVKRPESIECDIHHVNVNGEKWMILVGLVNNSPYEVFGGKSEYITIPKHYVRGKIQKRARSTVPSKYDLNFGDDGLVRDIGTVFENKDYQTLTRMVSMSLRHGVRPSFVIEQLQKDDNEDLTGFVKVLSRVLKKYIEDGTKVSSDKTCKECSAEQLVYRDGCIVCISCGWSKCM